MSALDEARTKLRAALADKSGSSYEQFRRVADANRTWETEMFLAHDCYGEWLACISCGCSKGRPCVSHAGNRRHMAELKEREVAALEALAASRAP